MLQFLIPAILFVTSLTTPPPAVNDQSFILEMTEPQQFAQQQPRQQRKAESVHHFTRDQFLRALSSTPWEERFWPGLWSLSACETTGTIHAETINARAVGDRNLAHTGPSVGALQVNVAVHTELNERYDLMNLAQNLTAAHSIWVSAGESFWPWETCSRLAGLR